jgi:hypothetical protein
VVNDFREALAIRESLEEDKEIAIGMNYILGYLEGSKMASETIALRMAKMKVPLETIAKALGLSPSAIKSMKKSQAE